jgi:lysophospholipase L1-like esterase
MRLWPATILALLAFATACAGAGTFYQASTLDRGNVTPQAGFLYSYGDSITAGVRLTIPDTQAFPALLAAAHGNLALNDLAVSGDQSCDVPTHQIFSNWHSPSNALNGTYTLLIGTNDADHQGAGAYEAVFNLCQQASIAWVAVPAESKVLATDPSVTSTGAGHLDSSMWNARVTDAPNASLTFPLHLSVAAPLYIWYRIADGNLGTFSYAVDGSVLGSLTSGTSPTISTLNASNNSLALLRIPAVATGSHTVTITQTSAGTSGAGIVAVGSPPRGSPDGLSRVLVGTTPRQLAGSGERCAQSDSNCLAYTADTTANVALFAADGLKVQLFDTRKYERGTSADMADGLHPDATGHQEIFHAIQDIY